MKKFGIAAVAAIVLSVAGAPTAMAGEPVDGQFIRGQCEGASPMPTLGDVIFTLDFIFNGNGSPGCLDACDVNDDGMISFIDPLQLCAVLFSGGTPPAAPFPDCGFDATDDALDCAVAPSICAP